MKKTKMIKGKLSRLLDGETSGFLRTQDAIGEFSAFPTKGRRFQLIGEPLETNSKKSEFDFRLISTSEVDYVVFIEKTQEYRFTTQSGSVYLLEVLSDKESNVAV